jgi:hypothetical protein
MNNKALPIGNQISAGWFDFFIVLGAIALVAFVTFLWAVFIRKPAKPRRKHRHHHASYRERFRKNAAEIRQLVQPRQRKHSEHHPLNPTLAQTGGLPPVREEEISLDQTPPPTSQP